MSLVFTRTDKTRIVVLTEENMLVVPCRGVLCLLSFLVLMRLEHAVLTWCSDMCVVDMF